MPWSDPAASLLALSAAVLSSALGTWLAIAYSRRQGLYDAPGARRSHAVTTPRGAGIGIAVTCLSACAAIAFWHGHAGTWLAIGAGLLVVAGVGWWDDHRPLPALRRLAAHGVAATLLAIGVHLDGGGIAVCVASFLLVLCLVNAWNFMDGINGLAASQAMLCGLAFGLLADAPGSLLAIVLAGACLGFLPFNFPKARGFLGDAGSGALGYLVAALLATALSMRPYPSWPLLLLPAMAMLADSGLTLLRRIQRRERWWEAHVQHVYQRWSRVAGHSIVTTAYGFWTIMTAATMLALDGKPGRVGVYAFSAWVVTSAVFWCYLRFVRYGGDTEGFGS